MVVSRRSRKDVLRICPYGVMHPIKRRKRTPLPSILKTRFYARHSPAVPCWSFRLEIFCAPSHAAINAPALVLCVKGKHRKREHVYLRDAPAPSCSCGVFLCKTRTLLEEVTSRRSPSRFCSGERRRGYICIVACHMLCLPFLLRLTAINCEN